MSHCGLTKQLKQGLEQMHLSYVPIDSLLALIDLLIKWNQHVNLTSITDPHDILVKHILDSLSLVPYLGNSKRILDVGTGAGFPGLPLAIADNCSREWVLIDASQRKIDFVHQVCRVLSLKSVCPMHIRVEDLLAKPTFDVIMSRAVTSARAFIHMSRHCCSKNGRIILMKGSYPENELNELKEIEKIEAIEEVADKVHVNALDVPFLDAKRHVVIIEGVGFGSSHSDY